MPALVAAPDKFRGTATAGAVASAMARTADGCGWTGIARPLSDGGDGLLDVFSSRGLDRRETEVCGPAGRPVLAEWRTDGSLAVIEMARSSGLLLAGGPARNDALAATSLGTGQLIVAAVDAVAPDGRVLVGLGGSASTDGGWEAANAVRAAGGLQGASLIGACDVRIGFVDAARLFAPQKGASEDEVGLLEGRLESLAERYRSEFGVEVTSVDGAGAAGGFGGAVVALGGTLRSGYELVAEAVGLRAAMEGADLVLTGEGALDAQSFMGKVVGGVIADAASVGVPVAVVAGRVTDEARAEARRRDVEVVSLVERFGRSTALADPVSCVEKVVADILSANRAVTG